MLFLSAKLRYSNHKIKSEIYGNLLKINILIKFIFRSESGQDCVKSRRNGEVCVLGFSISCKRKVWYFGSFWMKLCSVAVLFIALIRLTHIAVYGDKKKRPPFSERSLLFRKNLEKSTIIVRFSLNLLSGTEECSSHPKWSFQRCFRSLC